MLIDLSKLIAALEGHTKALLAHAEALVTGNGGTSETPKKPIRGRPAAGETNGAATAPTQDQLATAQSAATAALRSAVDTSATAEKPVVISTTLQQVADAIIGLANGPTGGRDKAVAILAKHGAKKVPELKPETFAAVLVDVAAALAPSGADSLV